jgi:hypothetical protein
MKDRFFLVLDIGDNHFEGDMTEVAEWVQANLDTSTIRSEVIAYRSVHDLFLDDCEGKGPFDRNRRDREETEEG